MPPPNAPGALELDAPLSTTLLFRITMVPELSIPPPNPPSSPLVLFADIVHPIIVVVPDAMTPPPRPCMTKSAAAPFPPEIVTPEIVSVAKKLRMGNDWLPLIANEDAPGPEMLILVLTLSVPDVSWIVD